MNVMNQPIFIGGTGRSGTSILQRILAAHKNIYSLKWESHFIVYEHGLLDVLRADDIDVALAGFRENILGDWFQSAHRKGTPREYLAGLCDDIERDYLEGLVRDLDAELSGVNDHSGRIAPIRRFIERIFEPGVNARGKTRFGEDTPSNSLYMLELLELFPEARFINMVRDGRDVVASILSNRFWPINPALANPQNARMKKTVRNGAIFWRDTLEYILKVGRGLPKRSYMELKLEDLMAKPAVSLRRTCRFISEEYQPPLARLVEPEKAHVGRWRETFTHEDIDAFKEEAGQLLVEMGYERDLDW